VQQHAPDEVRAIGEVVGVRTGDRRGERVEHDRLQAQASRLSVIEARSDRLRGVAVRR
jgi:hypothetical protein